MIDRMWLRAGAVMVAGVLASGASPAQAPRLVALTSIETGAWQLQEGAGEGRAICLTDPRKLIQLQHPGAQCARTVIADEPRSVTVSYSCPHAGNGRTTITVETGRLIQVDTQGIADGAPFEMRFTGRRTGACS